jgi:hypothetical protein
MKETDNTVVVVGGTVDSCCGLRCKNRSCCHTFHSVRNKRQKITGIIKASHVVTHRNTGLTRCCLTSLSGTGSGMVSII